MLSPSLRPSTRSSVCATDGAGISLIEMLIALAVGALLLGVGMPWIAGWQRGLEVRSSTSELVALLQSARAEAITRNGDVRVTLGDARGRAVWSIGCVNVSARCPARLRAMETPLAPQARWGASASAGSPALALPLPPGRLLPAQVTFNALGAAPAVGSGAEVARIDILHPADAKLHRLIVLLGARGAVTWCDPKMAAGQARFCG